MPPRLKTTPEQYEVTNSYSDLHVPDQVTTRVQLGSYPEPRTAGQLRRQCKPAASEANGHSNRTVKRDSEGVEAGCGAETDSGEKEILK